MSGNNIYLENTKFIYKTNFSGDPERSNVGSPARKVTIVIPTQEQADELSEAGFNVKCTAPKEGEEAGFIPQYFVPATINYDSPWPPRIYQVQQGKDPELLTEETVDRLDKVHVTNVNTVLNPFYSKRNKRWSLYVKTMYVEYSADDDPFAARYRRPQEEF